MGRPLPSDLATNDYSTKDVILGMPGPWAEENQEHSDHYTTKIGGLPDWAMAAEAIHSELRKCGLCGGDLALVAQIYAPVSIRGIKIDERTLYIFGCPSSSCGISPLSWRTLRVQSTSQNRVTNDLGSAAVSSSSVADVASDELREQEVGNDSNNQHKGNEWWDNDGWEPEAIRRDDMAEEAFLAMDELESALLEAGYTASASSIANNLEVEEEIVSIDENGTTDSVGHDLPVLPCFYVYPQNESRPSQGIQAASALESIDQIEVSSREEVWEGEEYEHDMALSADRTYLKFKKRLDTCPEQCFRYRFKGKPLWACKDETETGMCSHCGGPRVYEMQLMPPLLYYLQQACRDYPLTSYSPNAWEWLTLIVFSCAKSCTPSVSDYGEVQPWVVVEEVTILQYEA